eukprot:3629297-Pyramimonas_sp.AAC.1
MGWRRELLDLRQSERWRMRHLWTAMLQRPFQHEHQTEKWDEQWQKHSADHDFRAQQQKFLDECNADELNAQRIKEQAEEQIRLSSERSVANIREKAEALARAVASEREVVKLKAIITESFPYGEKE